MRFKLAYESYKKEFSKETNEIQIGLRILQKRV